MTMKKTCRNVHKKNIVSTVATKTGMPQTYASQVVEQFMREMITELARGYVGNGRRFRAELRRLD